MKISALKKTQGFTLIELIVSMSLFMLVMTMSMGSIIGVFDVNRKSQAMKTVMSNLNLAIESMAREMRFGDNYHCGSSGTITAPQNCPNGGDFVSFLSSDDEQIIYRLEGGVIEKSSDGGGSYAALTGSEVDIEDLSFYVLGAGAQSPSLQPKVLIKVSGVAGPNEKSRTEFTLQTLVSQRVLDN
jgi:type II secretory pathway pseudopilin PulG